jgi:hypothetical protein
MHPLHFASRVANRDVLTPRLAPAIPFRVKERIRRQGQRPEAHNRTRAQEGAMR